MCPYEEARLCDIPISPLLVVEFEPWEPYKHLEWKAGLVCHKCFAALHMDMWCSSRCWESLNPITPFERLPDILEPGDDEDYQKKWNEANYHLSPEDEEVLRQRAEENHQP